MSQYSLDSKVEEVLSEINPDWILVAPKEGDFFDERTYSRVPAGSPVGIEIPFPSSATPTPVYFKHIYKVKNSHNLQKALDNAAKLNIIEGGVPLSDNPSHIRELFFTNSSTYNDHEFNLRHS